MRVDNTAPAATSKSPSSGAADVDPAKNIEVVFSEGTDPNSVNGGTIFLSEDPGTDPIPANVRYEPETNKAVLNPDSDLDPGTRYKVTIKGGQDGVKDAAGNALAADETWSFATRSPNTTPPDTKIDSGPEGPTKNVSPSFAFSSSEPGSSFRCSLDEAPFSECIAPRSYENLAEGPHYLRVTATDAAGNEDPSPAQRNFRVDTTAPVVSGQEPAPDAAKVARNANVVVTFSEEVDTATFTQGNFSLAKKGQTTPIASSMTPDPSGKPATLDPAADLDSETTYTVTVKGGNAGVKDKAGNAMAADDSWSFTTADTVAPTPPTMKLAAASDTGVSTSDGLTNDNTPTLEGTAEANSIVRVYEGTTLLGTATAGAGGAWSVTPATALADGTRYLRSTATDASGNTSGQTTENTSSSSQLLEVRIDTTRPYVTSVSPPQGTNTVAAGANAFASFSEDMDPASVNASNFVHWRSGTTTPLAATVSYAPAPYRQATLDPGANLVAHSSPTTSVPYHRKLSPCSLGMGPRRVAGPARHRPPTTNYVVAYPSTYMASRERKDAMGRGSRLVPKLPPFHRAKAFCQPLLQPYGAPFLAEFVPRAVRRRNAPPKPLEPPGNAASVHCFR